MADHSDAADPRLDITDLFVFPAPEDPGSTVVILNLHPDAPEALSGLDPDASYELKIDTNGDAEADVALHILFAAPPDDEPTATVYRSTGRSARRTGRQGELLLGPAPVSLAGSVRVTARDACRFFAGVRSDPWFVDIAGFFDDFRWTGRDYFAERNIFGIVLEVPNIVLGATGPTGIWARTMAPGHRRTTQIDQMGRPLINAVYNRTEADRAEFNGTPPARQVATFFARFVATLESLGYGAADSAGHAARLLPDVLGYDPMRRAGYPNGRRLTDDILDLRISELTMGRVTGDGIGPHADLLDEFPYLGAPHRRGP